MSDAYHAAVASRATHTARPVVSTVGEIASEILDSFLYLAYLSAPTRPTQGEGDEQRQVERFIASSMALLHRFPAQTRTSFAAALPFTRLELALIGQVAGLAGTEAYAEMSHRIVEWATRSPIVVDEASVHVAEFLSRLAPHLDRWDERVRAKAAAETLTAV